MKNGAIKIANDNHEWYIINWIDRNMTPGYQLYHPPESSFYFIGESEQFEDVDTPSGYYTVYDIVEKNCQIFVKKTDSYIRL